MNIKNGLKDLYRKANSVDLYFTPEAFSQRMQAYGYDRQKAKQAWHWHREMLTKRYEKYTGFSIIPFVAGMVDLSFGAPVMGSISHMLGVSRVDVMHNYMVGTLALGAVAGAYNGVNALRTHFAKSSESICARAEVGLFLTHTHPPVQAATPEPPQDKPVPKTPGGHTLH